MPEISESRTRRLATAETLACGKRGKSHVNDHLDPGVTPGKVRRQPAPMGPCRGTSMETKQLDRVVIRFAGDSGDGMQLTGTEFAKAAAEAGNDISTFPDFPAEIRAPAGSLFGVSGFQLHFSSSRDLHARRCARRPRRDESGGAQDEPQGPRRERHADHQHRRVHRGEPQEGRLLRRTRSTTARSRSIASTRSTSRS